MATINAGFRDFKRPFLGSSDGSLYQNAFNQKYADKSRGLDIQQQNADSAAQYRLDSTDIARDDNAYKFMSLGNKNKQNIPAPAQSPIGYTGNINDTNSFLSNLQSLYSGNQFGDNTLNSAYNMNMPNFNKYDTYA